MENVRQISVRKMPFTTKIYLICYKPAAAYI